VDLKGALNRAQQAMRTMQDEFRKGRDGDTSPVRAIGPSIVPALKHALASLRGREPEPTHDTSDDAVVDEVADAVRRVDWKRVASSIRDNRAVQQMKDLAAEVDWAKAKPAAARVGTVLIAAAASGQLAGPKTTMIARTIVDTGLADKVAAKLNEEPAATPGSVLHYIDTTATETDTFDEYVGDLSRALGPGD